MDSSRRCIPIAVAVVVLPAFAAFGQPPAQPPYWLGETRGPHSTGTIEELWVDDSRDERQTSDPGDKRHLMVRMWYPANTGPASGGARYAPSIDLYSQSVQERFAVAAERRTRSVMNADIKEGTQPYPVLVFNHGGGVPNFSSTFLTEYLASEGYFVVSIGHPGSDGIERFPDGTMFVPDIPLPLSDDPTLTPRETYLTACDDSDSQIGSASDLGPALQESYAVEVDDISFVLDRLTEVNTAPGNPFYERLDLERVGAFGWSAGGATAFQAAADESRVKAAVNLDGWLWCRPVESSGAAVPIMLVESTEPADGASKEIVDPGIQELLAEVNRRTWQTLRLTEADWYRVDVLGTGHPSFSDTYFIETPPPGVLAQERAAALVQTLILEFFDKYLRGAEHSPILSRDRSVPEIRIETLRPPQ